MRFPIFVLATILGVEGQEVHRWPTMRRELGGRKHRSNWGLLEVSIDAEGVTDTDTHVVLEDVCEALCDAIDITSVSKKCMDLSNEECASASFYETLENGDRRPCALKFSAGMSLSDPKAENCDVDSKRTCMKGKPLCAAVEEASSQTLVMHDTQVRPEETSAKPINAVEDCQICAGRGDFLPKATAFMEDGVPFTCQSAMERIRSGETQMNCAEAAEQLVDCCAGPSADPPSSAANVEPDVEFQCDLCAGRGSLNSSEVAMMIGGSQPMTCEDAELNLKKGIAPISCEAARESELVSRCCIPSDDVFSDENCSLCTDGEQLDAEFQLSESSGTCGEVQDQLQNQKRSCNDASFSHLKSQCCRCDLCKGQAFLPESRGEGDFRCGDLSMMVGNGSLSCIKARRRASGCCAPPPGEVNEASAASEAEAHGEEATPFCKNLCLKTDVREWNLTCEELPKDECISTHFFQTMSACERRLCVWSAPWSCIVDSTQACLSCNWPCGRKATTSTTSTTTTTTSSTTTTTTTTSSSIFGAIGADYRDGTDSDTDTDDYYVDGEVVPSGCFDFCSRTDVRSMSVTCHQLTENQCTSGHFYQTDVKGNRRYCSFDGFECLVDDGFVCNASMPICAVPEEAATHSTTSSQVLTTTLPDGSKKADDSDAMEDSVVEFVEAAARECLASGSTDKEIWVIFQAAAGLAPSTPVANPANRALKKALGVAFLMKVPRQQLLLALRRAGVALDDEASHVAWEAPRHQGDEDEDSKLCASLCSKEEVAEVSNCTLLSVEMCQSGNFYQHGEARVTLCQATARKDSCVAGTTFSCSCNASLPFRQENDEIGHDTFCRSLCSKMKVENCSALSDTECASEKFFAESDSGIVLCQPDALGHCISTVAAAVKSVKCQLSELCIGMAHATSNTTSSTTSSTTSTTTSRSTETTTVEGEIPLFAASCGSETCPQVTTALCDGEWKQTGTCRCHCKRFRPHIVMLQVNSLGFNDFLQSSDLTKSWSFLKSKMPESILINSSYVELGSAPSRAAFLTGRFAGQMSWADAPSLSGNEGWSPPGVSQHRQLGSTQGAFAQVGEHTIAEKLSEAGYKSYAIGKWQAGGVSWRMTPGGRGFSRFFGSYDDSSDYVKHCDMNGHYDLHYEETEQFEANGSWRFHRPYHYYPSGPEVVGKHANSIFQEKATQFIREHQIKYAHDGTPMFLYYAPMSFQEPLQAPRWTAENCTFEEGFRSAANANRQTFCRMATSLDQSIFAIAEAMTGSFLEDNWIMVVTSDSGGSVSHRGSGGSNWPLRGSKGEVWEGGIRTHAMVLGTHPELELAKTKNHTYSGGFMHLVDWHATLLHLAHATPTSLDPPNDMNGISMWKHLVDDLPSPRTELISNATRDNGAGGISFRSGDYKLLMAPSGGKNPMTGENQGFRWPVRDIDNNEYLSLYDVDPPGSRWTRGADWKLYNIRTDPTEKMDLSQVLPKEVQRLQERLQAQLDKGRRTDGNSLLKCGDHCALVPSKALEVMREHSNEIENNECPIQEAAYPFWEEAMERTVK